MKQPHRLNLRKVWKFYQFLGKDKLRTEGLIAGLSTVSKEDFSILIKLIKVKGKTPMQKQVAWTQEVLSLGLEEFAKIMQEIFNGS